MGNIPKNMLIACSLTDNTLSLVPNNAILSEDTKTYKVLDSCLRDLTKEGKLLGLLISLGITDPLIKQFGANYKGTPEEILLDCIFDHYISFESYVLQHLNKIHNNHNYIETNRCENDLLVSTSIPEDSEYIYTDLTVINGSKHVMSDTDSYWSIRIYPLSIFTISVDSKVILYKWDGYTLKEIACAVINPDGFDVVVTSDNPSYSSITNEYDWYNLVESYTPHKYSTSGVSNVLKEAAKFKKDKNGLYIATFLTGQLDFQEAKLCLVIIDDDNIGITGFFPDIMPNVESDTERYLSIEGTVITDQIALDIIKVFNSFNGILPTKEILLEKLEVFGLTKTYFFEKD